MIYLDTCYLLKCYLTEPGSPEVRELVDAADGVASSIHARVEFAAAVHRHFRENRLTAAELVGVLDAFNYGNPKYLRLITGWSEAIQGRHPSGKPLSPGDASPISRGTPEGVSSMHHMVDESTASAEVLALYQRIKDMHCHHGPSSDYRLLANYPDYLGQALDDVIAPVARSADYDAKQRELIVEARTWVRTLPGPVGPGAEALLPTCSPRDIAGLTGLLFMYQRFIADITIDIIRLKQAFDGDQVAGTSPFPTP